MLSGRRNKSPITAAFLETAAAVGGSRRSRSWGAGALAFAFAVIVGAIAVFVFTTTPAAACNSPTR
jgi:hypothetical protein